MASSSTVQIYSYDVFLSFRGEDTRNNFTDHLYDGLKRAGILAFRDNEEIEKGEQLQPEIERAIKASRASIVVLSQNYATSTWCLDELLLILEQNHFVLPVFHHVDPSDVRKQEGSFTVQVKPGSKWTYDKVCRWKTALTRVANLSGITVSDSSLETRILKEIVDIIYNKLDRKEVHLPLNIIGMEARYKKIKSWFNEFNLEFLSIYGMGGSGKTTLAKHIFNKHRRTFDYVSFVEDIGLRCKGPNDLIQLQEQLLEDISGGKKREVPGISRGTSMIEAVLQKNKTLIVLDDILDHSQLVALLGTKINAQSKIIITTRENTDDWFKLSSWRCQKYVMRLLNDSESLELLSCHAFGSKFPNDSYMELLLKAARFCEGNPLALEVLGSSLLKDDAISYWESLLSLFGNDIDSRIQSVLKRSYMSLPSDIVKQLFLHIACFFIDIDMDYVVKILEPDYSATFGIKTLIDRCLLFVSPNKKLMMHRLLQEMGKRIVCEESENQPAKRSRVWLNRESYKILRKGKGSETVQGLALDMKILRKEDFAFTSSELKTDALKNMDNLKLLQLNFVELDGSYENFSVDLRWLCWLGFHLRTIPDNLYMGNLVAIDMSYSNLEVFKPPMVIRSLKILNLKDSRQLTDILNVFNIPKLETLVLWNCHHLVNVCKSITDLKHLELLNMTGCKNLFRSVNPLAASTSGGDVTEQPTFSFPSSLTRLILNDCHLICTDSLPLSFLVKPPVLQYLNLANSLFEALPCYTHLENLRVLNLSFCSRLTCLERLPNTLAELFVYYCELLERITFQSPRFTLQEFGYEGCINLNEIEGFLKLVPIAKLKETDLGHMNWLKAYQNLKVCLGGDDQLTVGRNCHIQMLYEFNIMSTSLPEYIKDPNMAPEYTSKLSSLSFDVPPCPENKRLKGINVTLKYAISGNECAWFCKISTTNGVDLMYNPKVFGKPEIGIECIWLSYWPIGNKLTLGDTVCVNIVVLSGLEIHECGVSLVYSDVDIHEDNMGWEEIIGGDLSGFQLSNGVYYLCRNDFFELMEVGRLTPYWFSTLVGDTIDYTEIRGWRKTGRPKQMNPSFTELKTIRCNIHGPQLDIYNITEMSKSYSDKSVALTASLLMREIDEIVEEFMSLPSTEETYDKQELKSGDFTYNVDEKTIMREMKPGIRSYEIVKEQKDSTGMSKASGSIEIKESDSPSHGERSEYGVQEIKEIVLAVKFNNQSERRRMMKELSALQGVESIKFDKEAGKLTVTGDVDPETVIKCVSKIADTEILSVGPAPETEDKPGNESEEDKKGRCSIM